MHVGPAQLTSSFTRNRKQKPQVNFQVEQIDLIVILSVDWTVIQVGDNDGHTKYRLATPPCARRCASDQDSLTLAPVCGESTFPRGRSPDGSTTDQETSAEEDPDKLICNKSIGQSGEFLKQDTKKLQCWRLSTARGERTLNPSRVDILLKLASKYSRF